RQIGEPFAQRLDGLDFLLRRENTTLELDRAETIFGDHFLRLPHDSGRIKCRAPFVGLGAGMSGPFVEKVSAVWNGVPNRAAEQIAHRPPRGLSLQVKEC